MARLYEKAIVEPHRADLAAHLSETETAIFSRLLDLLVENPQINRPEEFQALNDAISSLRKVRTTVLEYPDWEA